MKSTILPLLAAGLIACQAAAQSTATSTPTLHGANWDIARFGFALGGDIDMPLGLDHDYLLGTAHDHDFSTDGLPFSKGEMTMMDCDNGTARLNLSMLRPSAPYTEWQFSLLGIEGRIDMVRYEEGTEGAADRQWLEVSATNKETAVEVAYLRHKKTEKPLGFHWGVGTNMGISHGGQVHVKGLLLDGQPSDTPVAGATFEYTYRQRESLNQRLFVQGGMSVRFLRKMEFGLEMRKGLGYRASFGGPSRATFLKRSLGLSLRCKLF